MLPKTRKLGHFLAVTLTIALAVACLVRSGSAAGTQQDPVLAEKVRAANAQCFACHTQAGLANPPRADMDLVHLGKLLVNPGAYEHSNHGGVDCKNCHGQAVAVFPHRAGAHAEISQCSECHAQKVMRLEPQFDKSAHVRQVPGKFTCVTCHDPHKYLVAQQIGDPRRIVRQDNAMCIDCHGDDAAFHALAPDTRRPDLALIHDWLPNVQLHWQAVRCVECHTPPSTVRQLSLSHEILAKDRAERECVTCHTRDSSLRTRLYRHLIAEEEETAGFANAVILRSAYVVGATRNTYVDTAGTWLLGLTVAGVLVHGVLRIFAALRRRRQRR